MLNKLMVYVVLTLIVAIAVYTYYDLASFLEKKELSTFPSAKGYVSDEVWYVNSARNILHEIFNLAPYTSPPRASIIFTSKEGLLRAESLANLYNIKIIAGANVFSKLNTLYVEAQSIETIANFARNVNASDVVYGWIIGDHENINNYLNLEHPPTVKYIIALFIYVFGDKPLIWRIPSIIMGVLTVISTFLLVYELTKSQELGLIAATVVAVDPLIKVMSVVALLDIYVAAFTTLTLYVAAKGRFKEAALLLGFASTFKFTAVIVAIPLVFMYLNHVFKKGFKVPDVITSATYFVILMVLSFIFFQLLVSIPFILKIGLNEWLKQGIFGAISWHLSAKCIDPAKCPPYSAPWEWFFGINSFVLYLSPNIYAQGFVPAYTISFVLMWFALPSMVNDRMSRKAWYMIFGIFLGYLIIWLLGSRTQYSFYAVQLTPLIYSYLIIQLYEYLNRERIIETLSLWRKLVLALVKAILSMFR
ncbi:MAG: glycosyltransferase family 39 protein [Ignisphaera sp.]|uniref:Phospholipid carrier-dependent glycosyltransferase n=1 Tax=Ignisphaera aggregans TaxID=334771 RepID=A0A7J3MXE7_9CREN